MYTNVDSVKELLLSRITNKLNSRANISYNVLINNKLFKSHPKSQETKLAVIRCEFDLNGKPAVKMGYNIKAGNKLRFEEDTSILARVLDELVNVEFFGVDFSALMDESNTGLDINIYDDFKILDLRTSLYTSLLHQIYLSKEKKLFAINQQGTPMSDVDRANIISGFDKYLMDAYYDTMVNKISGRISSSSIRPLRFYNMAYNKIPTFVPVLVQAPFLFNPLLDGKSFNIVQRSKLFSQSSLVKKNLDNVTIYYLTNKQICECLNFKKYIRTPFIFTLKLLLGLFDDRYANNRVDVYIRREGANENLPAQMTTEKFMFLLKEVPNIRDSYFKEKMIYGLCRDYLIKSGLGKVEVLYDSLSDVQLVMND